MSRQSGFSLIEMLVVILISLFISLASSMLLINITRQSTIQKGAADTNKTSRTALFLLSRDASNAGYLLSCSGAQSQCSSLLIGSPVIESSVVSTANPKSLTFNYGSSKAEDPVSVKYSIDSNNALNTVPSLRRIQINSNGVANDTYVASNVIDMSWSFGVDPTNSGLSSFGVVNEVSSSLNGLRSIRIAILLRSPFPDRKYTSPSIIAWLGGNYAVPSDQLNYRFSAFQQDIYIANSFWLSP